MALLLRELATVLAMVLLHCGLADNHVEVKYQWTTPDFAFPSEAVRQAMINNGSYVQGNAFIIDLEAPYKTRNLGPGPDQRMFVTTPRLFTGIPATLSVLSRRRRQDADPASPLLEPYPNWEWNREGNCNGLTSVFRTQVDSCGRLWVIDSGVVDVFTTPRSICQPQVLVFDLRTDTLISRYHIPRQSLTNDSLLITIAVDVRPQLGACRGSFAYIADVVGYALVVYDAMRGRSWRVTNSNFLPNPAALQFTVGGQHFNYSDGIFGLALGPLVNGDRTLYFHSLSSFRESWVRTSVLRNESLFSADPNAAASQFQTSPGTRASQTGATAMNKDAVLVFNQLSNSSFNCWNSRLPYTRQNLVELVRDDAIQFVSGLKVVQGKRGEDILWALSCRFQDLIIYGSVNASRVNFRVIRASLTKLVKGTSCEVRRS